MRDNKNSYQKDKKKSDITINKHNKNIIKEKEKNIKKKREKEINEKENNIISENDSYNNKKNEQSKNIFINNFSKNENFVVNKEIKLQKTYEKNNNKIQKISEKYRINSEKIEISKICELSVNKIMLRNMSEKFFEYSKLEKNKEQKNYVNNNIEEDNTQENEKKMNYKKIDEKLNKKEIYENKSKINLEDVKKEKININNKIIEGEDKDEKQENKIYEYKNYYKFDGKFFMDDFTENEYRLNNKNIKKGNMKNNKNKYYIIYILYFYYLFIINIFSSKFIKCYHRKIELSSSYINLKINATGELKILSDKYVGEKPIISINNVNYTINDIETFTNSENDIINVTLIWDNSVESTSCMFNGCDDIIEIDLSHFDASNVRDMEYICFVDVHH